MRTGALLFAVFRGFEVFGFGAFAEGVAEVPASSFTSAVVPADSAARRNSIRFNVLRAIYKFLPNNGLKNIVLQAAIHEWIS
jgi:hypothetical protein